MCFERYAKMAASLGELIIDVAYQFFRQIFSHLLCCCIDGGRSLFKSLKQLGPLLHLKCSVDWLVAALLKQAFADFGVPKSCAWRGLGTMLMGCASLKGAWSWSPMSIAQALQL